MQTTGLLFAIDLAGRVCLAIVFVTAAAGKLQHAEVLEGVVANYRLLPAKLVRPVAKVLPWAELLVGLALLAPVSSPIAAAAAVVLLLGFAWAMAVNLTRGRAHIDCGCQRSELRQPLQWSLVARNLLLAAWLAAGLVPEMGRAPTLAAPLLLAAGVAGGLVGFLFYAMFNALASLSAFKQSIA